MMKQLMKQLMKIASVAEYATAWRADDRLEHRVPLALCFPLMVLGAIKDVVKHLWRRA